MAKSMSQMFLGKQIDGIWHSGIVVYGFEYFYGGGIQKLPPTEVVSHFQMAPTQKIPLGTTQVTQELFEEFLRGVNDRFTPQTYDLFRHNCNNFADEVAKFLLDTGIPRHIIDLPNEVLSTPMGQQLAPMITQMQNQMYAETGQANPFTAGAAAPDAGSFAGATSSSAPASEPAELSPSGQVAFAESSISAHTEHPILLVHPAAVHGSMDFIEAKVDLAAAGVSAGDLEALSAALEAIDAEGAKHPLKAVHVEDAAVRLAAATSLKLLQATTEPAVTPAAAHVLVIIKELIVADNAVTALAPDVLPQVVTLLALPYESSRAMLHFALYGVLRNLAASGTGREWLRDTSNHENMIAPALRDINTASAPLRTTAASALFNLVWATCTVDSSSGASGNVLGVAAAGGEALMEECVQLLISSIERLQSETAPGVQAPLLRLVGLLVATFESHVQELATDLGLGALLNTITRNSASTAEVKGLATSLASLVPGVV